MNLEGSQISEESTAVPYGANFYWLERLVSEIIYCVLSGMLNPAFSLTHSFLMFMMTIDYCIDNDALVMCNKGTVECTYCRAVYSAVLLMG